MSSPGSSPPCSPLPFKGPVDYLALLCPGVGAEIPNFLQVPRSCGCWSPLRVASTWLTKVEGSLVLSEFLCFCFLSIHKIEWLDSIVQGTSISQSLPLHSPQDLYSDMGNYVLW